MPSHRERRPDNDSYYERRHQALSQGDIFRDVPLGYPAPAGEILEEELEDEEHDENTPRRRFLSGPLDFGPAMLITPTCSMGGDPADDPPHYDHPVRTLVPIRPLEELVGADAPVRPGSVDELRLYDHLINYTYIPPSPEHELAEGLALLYMPITLHHDLIEGQRVTQLSYEGTRQLQRKLTWLASGLLLERGTFNPPMD